MAMRAARIGPNAITQVAAALDRVPGTGGGARFLELVGLGAYIAEPPAELVTEWEVRTLHRAVRERLDPDIARVVEQQAGRATARYLLANRIPQPVAHLLRLLPARPAAHLLLAAIRKHAWTFTGGGRFDAQVGDPVTITIEDCPLSREVRASAPVCDYFAATFEELFRELVHPRTQVLETRCAAAGASCCRFEIRWDATASL